MPKLVWLCLLGLGSATLTSVVSNYKCDCGCENFLACKPLYDESPTLTFEAFLACVGWLPAECNPSALLDVTLPTSSVCFQDALSAGAKLLTINLYEIIKDVNYAKYLPQFQSIYVDNLALSASFSECSPYPSAQKCENALCPTLGPDPIYDSRFALGVTNTNGLRILNSDGINATTGIISVYSNNPNSKCADIFSVDPAKAPYVRLSDTIVFKSHAIPNMLIRNLLPFFVAAFWWLH